MCKYVHRSTVSSFISYITIYTTHVNTIESMFGKRRKGNRDRDATTRREIDMFRPTCLKGRLHKISAVHTTACLIRLCCRSCRHVLAASLLVPAWTAPAAAGLNQPYGDRGVSGARHRGRPAPQTPRSTEGWLQQAAASAVHPGNRRHAES